MVDEFLAKASISQCSTFAETAEVIAKVGFKMFLGVNVEVRPLMSLAAFASYAAQSPFANRNIHCKRVRTHRLF